MTDRSEWEGRVGRKWADEWRRTDRSFGGLTDRLLGLASAGRIVRALDVGCGAGEVSLALARGHPEGSLVGIDVSKDLVDTAGARGAHLDNVSFEQADAAEWRRADFSPDLVVSRHGVMFFPDPVAAFAHLRRIAASDARLVFSCFRAMAENPWAARIASLLPADSRASPDPDAPGPFAFADRARVEGILTRAGWRYAAFEKLDFAYIAGAGDDPVGDARAYFLAIGPAARAAASLPEDERDAFIARLRRFLESHAEGAMVALPAGAWLVSAQSR